MERVEYIVVRWGEGRRAATKVYGRSVDTGLRELWRLRHENGLGGFS